MLLFHRPYIHQPKTTATSTRILSGDLPSTKSLLHGNCLSKLKQSLNTQVFKNKNFTALCLNQIFVIIGISIVYVHLAAYAMSIGYNTRQSATLITATGISNLVGRIAFGFLGHLPWTTPIKLYAFGILVSGTAIGITPFLQSYPGLIVCSSLFGLFTGTFGTQLPQVSNKYLKNISFSFKLDNTIKDTSHTWCRI